MGTPTMGPPTAPPPPIPTLTMAMAEVEVAEECMDVYTDIKKWYNKKYPYAIFLIADGKIQAEAKGEKDGSVEEQYARFLEDLQKKDGDRDDCSFPTLMEAFNGVGRVKQATDISEIQQAEIEAW